MTFYFISCWFQISLTFHLMSNLVATKNEEICEWKSFLVPEQIIYSKKGGNKKGEKRMENNKIIVLYSQGVFRQIGHTVAAPGNMEHCFGA